MRVCPEPAKTADFGVIVVGADNEYIPKLLGWETSPSMEDALYRAKGGELRSLDVTLLKVPPIVMGDMRLPAASPALGNGGA